MIANWDVDNLDNKSDCIKSVRKFQFFCYKHSLVIRKKKNIKMNGVYVVAILFIYFCYTSFVYQ